MFTTCFPSCFVTVLTLANEHRQMEQSEAPEGEKTIKSTGGMLS